MPYYKSGKNKYITGGGKLVTNKKILNYIKSIGIPPNYKDVTISSNPNDKVLVKAKDEAGRSQWIYNKEHVKQSMRNKYCRLTGFGKKLPTIRKDIDKLLNARNITKDTLIALVLRIIDLCHFRIGNQKYEERYNSYGIGNIKGKHINFTGGSATITFYGKRNKLNECKITNKRVVNLLKKMKTTKNNYIFTYDDDGYDRVITPMDVNGFLKEYGDFTSKDYRTWMANVIFLDEILSREIVDVITTRKKTVSETVKVVAENLYHTPAICRKNYILGYVVNMYIDNPTLFVKIANSVKKSKIHDHIESVFIGFLEHYCKHGKA